MDSDLLPINILSNVRMTRNEYRWVTKTHSQLSMYPKVKIVLYVYNCIILINTVRKKVKYSKIMIRVLISALIQVRQIRSQNGEFS